MSEKRFKIEQKNVIKMSEKYRLIKHNKNLAEIENDRGVGLLFLVDEDCERKLEIIVDLLNEKDKEIGLLRLELETHKNPLWSTREAEKKVNKLSDSLADEVKKNGLLNEELNQLRIENEQLKKEYKIAIDEMVTDYKKLEKENEQLRKQLDFYLLDEFEWKEKYGD